MALPETKAAPSPQPTTAHGYAEAFDVAFREATLRVEEMHKAIGRQTYDVLGALPVVSGPSRLVQLVHETYTGTIYSAVRTGGAVASGIAKWVLAQRAKSTADAEATAELARTDSPDPIRAALNGIVGDYLVETNNPLAIDMGFYTDNGRLPLTRDGAAEHLPDVERVCIFLHGLCGDETNWRLYQDTAWTERPGSHYGALLEADLGYTPLYVRYNSGLPLTDNGRILADRMQSLVEAMPQLKEIVLIGHSMGGLVARSASLVADFDNLPWLERIRAVVCLGAPHQGAPLARFGKIATAALSLFNVTAPLGKVADVRSIGIKDLCEGLGKEGCEPSERLAAIPLRFVGGTLHSDPEHLFGKLAGDGMVSLTSSTLPDQVGDVVSVKVGGIHHMGLLNHPRVYEHIRSWL